MSSVALGFSGPIPRARRLWSKHQIKGEVMTTVNPATKPATSTIVAPAQIRVARPSTAYWRITIDNPPINVMGPEMVRQFQQVINALEADEQVRVVVFDSAVDDYFLNH